MADKTIATLLHENIGFEGLLLNCTNRPQDCYFSSLIVIQNLDDDQVMELGGVKMKEDAFN